VILPFQISFRFFQVPARPPRNIRSRPAPIFSFLIFTAFSPRFASSSFFSRLIPTNYISQPCPLLYPCSSDVQHLSWTWSFPLEASALCPFFCRLAWVLLPYHPVTKHLRSSSSNQALLLFSPPSTDEAFPIPDPCPSRNFLIYPLTFLLRFVDLPP